MGAKEEPMLFAEHRGKGEIKDVLFIDDITTAIADSPVRVEDRNGDRVLFTLCPLKGISRRE